MNAHPTIPMRGAPSGVVRNMKNVGKTSSSSSIYNSTGLKVYAGSTSDTSPMLDDGDWGFSIYEVDGTASYNHVRTVLTHSGTVSPGDHVNPPDPGNLLLDSTVNLNKTTGTYYVFRGSYDNNFGLGIQVDVAPSGNGFIVSQAVNYAAFGSSLDTEITTSMPIILGSGFPALAQSNGIQYDVSFQPALNDQPIWIWLAVG